MTRFVCGLVTGTVLTAAAVAAWLNDTIIVRRTGATDLGAAFDEVRR